MALIRSLQSGCVSAVHPIRAPRLSRRIAVDLAAAVVLTGVSAIAGEAAEPETAAAAIVAAQIRAQGYVCTRPVAAVREVATEPGVTVWRLSCGNARYRVRLLPDMAAHVTQLK